MPRPAAEREAEIRARCEAATAGKWRVKSEQADYISVDRSGTPICALSWLDSVEKRVSNAEFIAHAREDIPALLDEIAALREENRWIPVAERLPKHNQWCLVSEGGTMINGMFQYSALTNTFYNAAFDAYSTVTHWRPLPAPPNTKENEREKS